MKKIAVVTGASSGMGKEFALTIKNNVEVDEVWLIARDEKKLKECANDVGIPSKIISIDLTSDDIKNMKICLKRKNQILKF